MEVIWTERALASLEQISEHIAKDNPAAAQRWVARLSECAHDATTNPHAGRVVPELGRDDVREVFLRTYRIVYQVVPDALRVLVVLEGRRLLHDDELGDVDE